jgi:hypothetical protein
MMETTVRDDGFLWDLHVKHPPPGPFLLLTRNRLKELPSLYRDGEVDEWGRIHLDKYRLTYERTGDALLVLDAFVLAHRENLYPPMWVLEILTAAFQKYLSDQGSNSLEQLLMLAGQPKQGSSFKQRAKRRRDYMLAEYMCLYAALKPCSLETAADCVASHWQAGVKNGLYKFGYDLDKPLDKDTLLQYYDRRWRAQFMCDEKYLGPLSRAQTLTDGEKEQFLKKFDP